MAPLFKQSSHHEDRQLQSCVTVVHASFSHVDRCLASARTASSMRNLQTDLLRYCHFSDKDKLKLSNAIFTACGLPIACTRSRKIKHAQRVNQALIDLKSHKVKPISAASQKSFLSLNLVMNIQSSTLVNLQIKSGSLKLVWFLYINTFHYNVFFMND